MLTHSLTHPRNNKWVSKTQEFKLTYHYIAFTHYIVLVSLLISEKKLIKVWAPLDFTGMENVSTPPRVI